MSLEQTKQLLRTFRIAPNKLLGQNFMTAPALYPKLTEYAKISNVDVVLDAGSGFGFLTKFLANKCKAVVAVEKDPRIAKILREQVKDLGNVTVVEGDVLKTILPNFSKVVAVPPYYLSSRLVTWLFECRFECAVLIFQQEFANGLVAAVGSEDYSWLTVIATHHAKVELFDEVPKTSFYPQPGVDSIIIRLTPWQAAPFNVKNPAFFNRLVRWLFTQRNKKLCNALVPFFRREKRLGKEEAQKLAATAPFREKRPRNLAPKDFGELANVFAE